MKLKWSLVWLVLILGAFLLGHGWDTARAQQATGANQAWEIYHSAYGNNSFYVLKHNRLTGETFLLDAIGGADDDAWFLIPGGD